MKNEIEIELIGSAELGRCYYQHVYEVRSDRELNDDQIHGLREIGLLGYGQYFDFRRKTGTNKPFVVECVSRVDSSD